jgi:hypothetical protein
MTNSKDLVDQNDVEKNTPSLDVIEQELVVYEICFTINNYVPMKEINKYLKK